jgi:hypothetical protein
MGKTYGRDGYPLFNTLKKRLRIEISGRGPV